MTPADAAKWADVTMILTPDELQAQLYASDLRDNLREGSALAVLPSARVSGEAVLIKLHKRKQNGSCSGCRGCSRGQQSGSEPDDQNGPTHI